MATILQNFASGLWIVLGVYCFFGLRKWNKRFWQDRIPHQRGSGESVGGDEEWLN